MITPGVCSTTAGGLGPELIINGDFASASGWTLSSGNATISGGVLSLSGTGVPTAQASRASVTVANAAIYRVSVDYTNVPGPGYTVSGPSGDLSITPGSGTLTTNVTSGSTTFTPKISDNGNGDGFATTTFDNYSVRLVN